jgi:site-specific recombinase XerD
MARIKVRHFVEKKRTREGARHFWQPSASLRKAGFRLRRLSDDRTLAIQEAERFNADVDAWRRDRHTIAPTMRDGTLDALIAEYKTSDEYRDLTAKTRSSYDWALRVCAEWAGDTLVTLITRKRCKTFHNEMKKTAPAKARLVFAVLRLVFEHGVREEWIAANPASGHRFKRPKAKKGALWSRAAIDHFVGLADEAGYHSIGTAVLLNEWLGQREGDLIALPINAWQPGRGVVGGIGNVGVDQSKTGAGVLLPVSMVPHLVARIDAELEHRAKVARDNKRNVLPTTLLVCEATGRPWTEDHFRHKLREIRLGADERCPELVDLVFKDLRHTAVTRLAEADVDLPGIASITGHSLRRVAEIVDIYLVRTAKLARRAFAKRIEAERAGD